MIRKASLEEAKLIYTKNMEKDFPEDEIPDYNKFVKLTEKNIHDVYLYNNNNSDVAYFITVEKDNNILITSSKYFLYSNKSRPIFFLNCSLSEDDK